MVAGVEREKGVPRIEDGLVVEEMRNRRRMGLCGL